MIHDVTAIGFRESTFDLAEELEAADRFANQNIVWQLLYDR